jgi:hypothetical protein
MSGNYTTGRLYHQNPGYPDRHGIDRTLALALALALTPNP